MATRIYVADRLDPCLVLQRWSVVTTGFDPAKDCAEPQQHPQVGLRDECLCMLNANHLRKTLAATGRTAFEAQVFESIVLYKKI